MSALAQYATTIELAWTGQMPFADVVDHAARLEGAGKLALSAVLYRVWVDRTVSPYVHAAHFNLGATLTNLGDFVGAEVAYRKAIAIAPDFLHPRLNLGLLHERNSNLDEALAEWRWIVQNANRNDANRPLVVMAMNHLGRQLENRKQFGEALDYLSQSLRLDPHQPDALHHWVFLRQKQCAWPVYEKIEGVSLELMRESTSALAMIGLSDDPAAQLAAAKRFVEKKLNANLPTLCNGKRYGHTKIRIAYLSSDFCLHPVSLLTVQLFELHNRDEFEVFGFSWSPDDGTAMRQRVIQGMDHFIPIHHLNDAQAAELIRSHEIDILVDLQGQTAGARADILGYRPAPVQITYLGLPATTGLPSIDYVIADEFLIPPEAVNFYSEKPLYMPHVYQVSDRKRSSSAPPSRSACGLPDDAFVFCSFNNSFKYTPEMFDVWMRLLKRVPHSVLWLLADNGWAEENLRKEAALRGIARERLIFAGRVSPEDYLARYAVADLFLDSFPFNAGTTANDCLWMGCPIVTLTGRSFAARMAGALLTAAQLPELITYNLADYEEVASALANDPARCKQLRAHLTCVRETGVLFDTPRFVRDLEDRLRGLVAKLPA